jgi:hypothetical protein
MAPDDDQRGETLELADRRGRQIGSRRCAAGPIDHDIVPGLRNCDAADINGQ